MDQSLAITICISIAVISCVAMICFSNMKINEMDEDGQCYRDDRWERRIAYEDAAREKALRAQQKPTEAQAD